MTDTTTEMLALADRIDAWSPEKHVPMTFIARERRMIVTALRASGGAYIEGQRSMQERAKAAQPGTAANPNENSYQRGKFDGVMEYRRAIASLPLEAQESDGGVEGHALGAAAAPTQTRTAPVNDVIESDTHSTLRAENPEAGIKPGPSDTPTSGDAVTWPPIKKAIWGAVISETLNDGHYIKAHELTDKINTAVLSALKPEAAPAGEVITVPFNPCLAKLRPDEPFFVLLGRDQQAPNAVMTWADDREAAEGKSAWTEQAREVAYSMAAYSGKPPATPPAITEREKVATKKTYIKPLRTIVEIDERYADQIRDLLNAALNVEGGAV